MYNRTMTITLPISQVRDDLPTLVANAKKLLNEYVITVKGHPLATLISYDEYESWKETNEILSDPVLMKSIKKGEKDIKAGRVSDWEDIKKQFKINV